MHIDCFFIEPETKYSRSLKKLQWIFNNCMANKNYIIKEIF